MKLKAGSLFYALVLSIIIAILSSSILLLSYTSRIEVLELVRHIRLRNNLESGMQLLLNSANDENDEQYVDLYNNGTDSVKLINQNWGVFRLLGVQAYFRKDTISTVVLAGKKQTSYALYLSDHSSPLAVCGKNSIRGTAILPKAGIKRAYIEGQNFSGTSFVEGAVKYSEKSFPPINTDIQKQLDQLINAKNNTADILEVEGELPADSLTNSFYNDCLFFHSRTALKINSGSYRGNIVVQSDRSITINGDAKICDLLVIAPKIIIQRGFRGSLQCFASDSILLEKDVCLSYPSVLAISQHKQQTNSGILVNENDSIYGSVLSIINLRFPAYHSCITLKKNSFVYGEVVSNDAADIQGTLYGSLSCDRIVLTTSSSVYENHLLNACIDQTRCSPEYIGSSWKLEENHSAVVKLLE